MAEVDQSPRLPDRILAALHNDQPRALWKRTQELALISIREQRHVTGGLGRGHRLMTIGVAMTNGEDVRRSHRMCRAPQCADVLRRLGRDDPDPEIAPHALSASKTAASSASAVLRASPGVRNDPA